MLPPAKLAREDPTGLLFEISPQGPKSATPLRVGLGPSRSVGRVPRRSLVAGLAQTVESSDSTLLSVAIDSSLPPAVRLGLLIQRALEVINVVHVAPDVEEHVDSETTKALDAWLSDLRTGGVLDAVTTARDESVPSETHARIKRQQAVLHTLEAELAFWDSLSDPHNMAPLDRPADVDNELPLTTAVATAAVVAIQEASASTRLQAAQLSAFAGTLHAIHNTLAQGLQEFSTTAARS